MDEMIRKYEGLGYFYLGKKDGLANPSDKNDLMLYKSNDLTTHAAIIGMTGSGKTGLGICLIEEAAIDNIPSLIIDPKGDMGNLLLAFPDLKPDDFFPWVDEADARRKGISKEALARETAETWRKGLESWYEPPSRISTYIADRKVEIYTPGSSAGKELSLLGNFSAPQGDLLHDGDTFNALVKTTVSSLLALLGMKPDTLQSMEFLLLSGIFTDSWQKGENLSLESLISKVIQPPFKKLGVLPLETVAPENKRMDLALRLNAILSSPGFAAWTRGEPLDIGKLLFDEKGKARVTILSISHLNDNERMFFVTLLLNSFISWMRRQAGASGLRALLYMDEVFGFFPATANPPSKDPMLFLLKQARAFGIGIVLSTQNPVDLDYKGLSNIGSWFLGRLQTKQDVERVLDGLVSGGGTLDKDGVRKLLTGLAGRHFVLKNAKEDGLTSFETRWALSFLRGPVTESEIRMLMAPEKKKVVFSPEMPAKRENAPKTFAAKADQKAPVLSAKITQVYGPEPGGEDCTFFPYLLGSAEIRYYNEARAIDEKETRTIRLPLSKKMKNLAWEDGEWLERDMKTLSSPASSCAYAPLPEWIPETSDLRSAERHFSDYLYQNCKLSLFRCKNPKLESGPNESENDFRLRLSGILREERDAALEKLKASYKTKEVKLREKLEKARIKLAKEEKDVSSKKKDTMISLGLTLVDAFFGGKRGVSRGTISKAGTSLKQGKRIFEEGEDVRQAQAALLKVQEEMAALEEQFAGDAAKLGARFAPESLTVEEFFIAPRKTDIKVREMVLLWEAF